MKPQPGGNHALFKRSIEDLPSQLPRLEHPQNRLLREIKYRTSTVAARETEINMYVRGTIRMGVPYRIDT